MPDVDKGYGEKDSCREAARSSPCACMVKGGFIARVSWPQRLEVDERELHEELSSKNTISRRVVILGWYSSTQGPFVPGEAATKRGGITAGGPTASPDQGNPVPSARHRTATNSKEQSNKNCQGHSWWETLSRNIKCKSLVAGLPPP